MTKLIKDISPTAKMISHEEFANALGAEETGITIDTRRNPISLFSLRQFLVKHLRSTGGRPKLEGTEKMRNKISFFQDDWRKLEKIANYYKKEGVNVSPGQVASVLIHNQIRKIELPLPKRRKPSLKC